LSQLVTYIIFKLLPQLDAYILFELIYTVLIFFLMLLILNMDTLIFNTFLNLKNIKLKYFIEKYFAYLTGKESNNLKNNFYVRQLIALQLYLLMQIGKKLFDENIFDFLYKKVWLTKIKMIKIKVETNNEKNKRELYRNLL